MNVSEIVKLRKMPTGRHARALKMMLPKVEAAGLDEVKELVVDGREVARETLLKELAWAEVGRGMSTARGKALLIDNQIDEQIGAIESAVKAKRVGDAGDPVVEKARELHSAVFGGGVGAITQQAFEVQEGIMDAMMIRFDGDLKEHVDVLGERRSVERLRRLIGEFKAELSKEETEPLTYDQLKASRAGLHEATCEVAVAVFYHLRGKDEATVKLRNEILSPLMYQQERVIEARRRQRVPTDVDPETGEEIVTPADLVIDDEAPEPVEA